MLTRRIFHPVYDPKIPVIFTGLTRMFENIPVFTEEIFGEG
jgi:hypothetical protein